MDAVINDWFNQSEEDNLAVTDSIDNRAFFGMMVYVVACQHRCTTIVVGLFDLEIGRAHV